MISRVLILPRSEKANDLHKKTRIFVSITSLVSHDELMKILKIPGISRHRILMWIGTIIIRVNGTGTFPIQSDTSCADRWITDEYQTSLCQQNPSIVAEKLYRIPIYNDELVDSAAELNAATAQKRPDYHSIKTQAISEYEKIVAHSQIMT